MARRLVKLILDDGHDQIELLAWHDGKLFEETEAILENPGFATISFELSAFQGPAEVKLWRGGAENDLSTLR